MLTCIIELFTGDAQQKLEDFVKQYRQRYDVEDENENGRNHILKCWMKVFQ